MPSLEVEDYGVPAVAAFTTLLESLLERAQVLKPTGAIEPALVRADLDDLQGRMLSAFADVEVRPADGAEGRKKTRQYAIIETAVRAVFSDLIVSAAPPSCPRVRPRPGPQLTG